MGGCLNLNCYIGKKVHKKFSYGFKNLVKLGVGIFFFKIPIGRTIFNFSCKTSVFGFSIKKNPNFFRSRKKNPKKKNKEKKIFKKLRGGARRNLQYSHSF